MYIKKHAYTEPHTWKSSISTKSKVWTAPPCEKKYLEAEKCVWNQGNNDAPTLTRYILTDVPLCMLPTHIKWQLIMPVNPPDLPLQKYNYSDINYTMRRKKSCTFKQQVMLARFDISVIILQEIFSIK